MSQDATSSLHSISSNPKWVVNGENEVNVDEEETQSIPNNHEALANQNVPVNSPPKLGFKNGDCGDLHRASGNSQSLLLIMAHGLTSSQGPARCLGDPEV